MRGVNSLVFFLPFLVGEGAGASVSGAAYTLLITGAVTSASENVASVKSRIANLLMHRSCWVVRGLGRETLPASVNQTSARRLFEGGRERAVFLAVGAGQSRDPAQMILRLIAVTLFDLPQSVILPGLDVVGVGFESALVPHLRELVVAERAIGVADQIGDRGDVVVAERLQLLDGRGIVVAVIDRSVGGAITLGEGGVLVAGSDFAGLLLGLGRLGRLCRGGRRRVVVWCCGVTPGDQRRRRQRPHEHCQRQKPDRKFSHASLL